MGNENSEYSQLFFSGTQKQKALSNDHAFLAIFLQYQ